jgi:hypothetical protein
LKEFTIRKRTTKNRTRRKGEKEGRKRRIKEGEEITEQRG